MLITAIQGHRINHHKAHFHSPHNVSYRSYRDTVLPWRFNKTIQRDLPVTGETGGFLGATDRSFVGINPSELTPGMMRNPNVPIVVPYSLTDKQLLTLLSH